MHLPMPSAAGRDADPRPVKESDAMFYQKVNRRSREAIDRIPDPPLPQ